MTGLATSGDVYVSPRTMGFDQAHSADTADMREAIRRNAHAKRTELTTLIGFAEMLADPMRNLPCEKRVEYGRIIHRAAANILAGEDQSLAQDVESLDAFLVAARR